MGPPCRMLMAMDKLRMTVDTKRTIQGRDAGSQETGDG